MADSPIISDDEIRQQDSRWKSDIEKKVDLVLAFATKYESYLEAKLEHEREMKLLRRAIIEKSLTALVVAMLAGAATLFWNGAKAWLATK